MSSPRALRARLFLEGGLQAAQSACERGAYLPVLTPPYKNLLRIGLIVSTTNNF